MELVEITPAQTIRNAHDSVQVIAQILEKQEKSLEDLETIKRNVEHLQIICDKDFAQDFPDDVVIFTNAINSTTQLHV